MSNCFYGAALRIVKILDAFLLAVPVGLGWHFYYANWSFPAYIETRTWGLVVLFVGIYCICGQLYDAFAVSFGRISKIIYSQSLSALTSDALIYFVLYLLSCQIPAIWPMVAIFTMQILLTAAWNCCAHWWYTRTFVVDEDLWLTLKENERECSDGGKYN